MGDRHHNSKISGKGFISSRWQRWDQYRILDAGATN
jgi:hypothetical protein